MVYSITLHQYFNHHLTVQKEWLEAFDLAKKIKVKKETIPSGIAIEAEETSYDESFNRKLIILHYLRSYYCACNINR